MRHVVQGVEMVTLTNDDYDELIEENRVLRFVLCMTVPGAEITVPWRSVYVEPVVDPDDLDFSFMPNPTDEAQSGFLIQVPAMYDVTDEDDEED